MSELVCEKKSVVVYRDAEAAGPVQLLREALAGLGGLGLGPQRSSAILFSCSFSCFSHSQDSVCTSFTAFPNRPSHSEPMLSSWTTASSIKTCATQGS